MAQRTDITDSMTVIAVRIAERRRRSGLDRAGRVDFDVTHSPAQTTTALGTGRQLVTSLVAKLAHARPRNTAMYTACSPKPRATSCQ